MPALTDATLPACQDWRSKASPDMSVASQAHKVGLAKILIRSLFWWAAGIMLFCA